MLYIGYKKLASLLLITTLSFFLFSLFFLNKSYSKGGTFHVEQITNDGFGNSSNFDFNDGLEFGSYYYVTTDTLGDDVGRIYRGSTGNVGSWSESATGGFGDANNTAIDAINEFENNLYVTTYNSTDGAEMWRSANGTSWTAVVGGGAGVTNGFGDANNIIIRETAVFNDSVLVDQYLWAFTDNDTDGTEFWRSTDGSTWAETTEPAFTDATKTKVVHGFEYASRLYIFVLDNNDAEASADDVEVWYTTGGATPTWNQLGVAAGTESFLNVIDDAAYLYFDQHGGNLYVGNINNTDDCEVWVSTNGNLFTLSETFTDSISVFPSSTTKGLIAGVGYTGDSNDIVRLYIYSGGNWLNTGIEASYDDFYFVGGSEYNNYFYVWGGFPGTILRADMRPTSSTPESTQTQLGDGVVEITFTVGDITDADNVRAKVEYDIGNGYQKATISESASNISATYGTPDVENDNEYQVGNASGWITTSTGANTISVKWLSKTDEPSANTTGANIRVTVYDGATTGASKTVSAVTVDNVNPTISETNLIDGQAIIDNPFVIRTKALDTAAGVWKVEFYVDNNLLCTDFIANSEGYYTCNWDTEAYQSDLEIRAYDQVGNTNSEILNLYVTLPETGQNMISLLYSGILQIFSPIAIFILKKKLLHSS
jgi:hypothetical protein